jgi:hypothetical protein
MQDIACDDRPPNPRNRIEQAGNQRKVSGPREVDTRGRPNCGGQERVQMMRNGVGPPGLEPNVKLRSGAAAEVDARRMGEDAASEEQQRQCQV